ncbi:MAG: hypothetical protein AAF902_02345 [Chloroflexota bacterium]
MQKKLHHFDEPISAHRVRKELKLSETTIEKIQVYADAQKVSFSRAVEFLVSLGLKKKGIDEVALSHHLSKVVKQESAAHFNRFAKLIVHAGLEAGAAKEAAQQLYFLELQKLASADDLEAAISVDPDTPEGEKIIRLHNKHKGRFRWRAIQKLKKPLAELAEILAEMTT